MVEILFILINDISLRPLRFEGFNTMSFSVFHFVSEVIKVNVESFSFEKSTTAGLIFCP